MLRSDAMPTVLMVENSADLLDAVSEALSEEGWEVLTATSWGEAFSFARTRKVDIVLCDVLLSDGKDGPTLRSKFVSYGLGHVPFAFMAASKREAAILAGEIVLLKPFSLSEVVATLSAAISNRRGEFAEIDLLAERAAKRPRP